LLNIIGLLFRIKARRYGINFIDPRQQRHRVGFAWNALREAFCGEQTGCLLALAYETLTTKPEQALEAVYEFIGEKPFKHDFNNIEFDAEEFDRRIGTPGLHRGGRSILSNEWRTLLPAELIRKYENDSFWLDPARNLYKVSVV
jgi:sulfotransferase